MGNCCQMKYALETESEPKAQKIYSFKYHFQKLTKKSKRQKFTRRMPKFETDLIYHSQDELNKQKNELPPCGSMTTTKYSVQVKNSQKCLKKQLTSFVNTKTFILDDDFDDDQSSICPQYSTQMANNFKSY